MANGYSVDDLFGFLTHAAEKGLMPAATAGALGVAARNVLGVLDPSERDDIRKLELDGVIKRFNNKRARDFNPSSLNAYGGRVRRAIDLFLTWREDPAGFSVKTRATSVARKKDRATPSELVPLGSDVRGAPAAMAIDDGSYQSSFPVRRGRVVTIANIPGDLTKAEADRLAAFIKMLASD